MISCERRGILVTASLLSLLPLVAGAASKDAGGSKARIESECVAKLNALVERGPDKGLNAEPFYRKALELYVEPPAHVDADALVFWRWPTELAETQRAAMSKWIDPNSDALTQLRLGVQKPCYWFQYKEDIWRTRQSNSTTYLPELLGFRAKLEVMAGKKEEAVRDLMACYRIGLDLKKRLMINEQIEGLTVSMHAVRTGLQILKEVETVSVFLEPLQRELAERSKNRSLRINLAGHELMTLAVVEKICTQWPGNSGTPKKEGAEDVVALVWSQRIKELYGILLNDEQVYAAFHGHTPEEMANLVRKAYAHANSIVGKTPFQLHEEGFQWDKSVREAVDENPVLLTMVPSIPGFAELSFRFEAARDALATVLVLLRYRNDKGYFPDDLKELISTGYLSRLPMDPYSDKPLVYRRVRSSFVLYSVGVDFQDNGGKHSAKWGLEPQGGDYVFWPVQELEQHVRK